MRNLLSRLAYKLFRVEIEALLVENLLMQIPPDVTQPFIDLMGQRKDAMRKWVLFEANSILNRPPVHQNSPERRMGMLIILQALLLAISSASSKSEELPSGTVIPARPEEPDKSWIEGVQNFVTRKIPDKK